MTFSPTIKKIALIAGIVIFIAIALIITYSSPQSTDNTANVSSPVVNSTAESNTSAPDSSTVTPEVATTDNTTPNIVVGNPPAAKELEGIDDITSLDLVIDQLPYTTDKYTFLFDDSSQSFIARIYATQNSSQANQNIQALADWLSTGNVAISTLKIDYLYQ